MITNYFKIAWRNLRNRIHLSAINILGLSLGLACTIVITLFVKHELSYDRRFRKSEDVFRIATSFFHLGTFAPGPSHLIAMASEFPEIEAGTRIEVNNDVPIESSNLKSVEAKVYEVDSTFFDVFDYEFAAGNPKLCLRDQNSIVITESVAKKYFGKSAALGAALTVGKNRTPMVVSGVIRDDDRPTHLVASVFMPFVENFPNRSQSWASAYVYNYVRLKPGFGQVDLERRIETLIKEHVYPKLADGISYEDWAKTDNAYKLPVQPLNDIYLTSKLRNEMAPGGSETNIKIFTVVALLILFLAMVNFANLSTAQAFRRAKEVGIRKTMGTSRKNLVGQFLTESVLIAFISLVISLVLAEATLLIYRIFMGQELLRTVFGEVTSFAFIVGFTFLVGIVAGIYPAFYLTKFNPIQVLKGKYQGSRKSFARNALVFFQYSVSVVLVAFVLIILKQLHFMASKDVGFDRENILVIENGTALKNEKDLYFERLKTHSAVRQACTTANPPVGSSMWIYTYQTKAMSDAVTYNTMPTDENFLETFGVKLLEGRNFNSTDTDSTAAILNEAAVKDLMLESPIGEEINPGLKVIGVVNDFHFKGVQQSIEPLVLRYRKNGYSMAFKLQGNIQDFLETANAQWKQMSPDDAIKYFFVEDNFEKTLEKERHFSKILLFFAVLAIFISSLGLFGLALFSSEQRIREIGIRRVFGASVASILQLLNRGFLPLILGAIAIATPIAIYVSTTWLSTFPYRTGVGAGVFLATTAGIVGLSWMTIVASSLRAARKNPVETLRAE